jgi:hypothetical protein
MTNDALDRRLAALQHVRPAPADPPPPSALDALRARCPAPLPDELEAFWERHDGWNAAAGRVTVFGPGAVTDPAAAFGGDPPELPEPGALWIAVRHDEDTGWCLVPRPGGMGVIEVHQGCATPSSVGSIFDVIAGAPAAAPAPGAPRAPSNPESAELVAALGDPDPARATALLREGHWSPIMFWRIGPNVGQLCASGQVRGAVDLLAAALVFDVDVSGTPAMGVNTLCSRLADDGNAQDLERICALLVQRSSHWVYSYYLGWACMRLDRHEEALGPRGASIAAFDSAPARTARARCYARLGRWEEAKEEATLATRRDKKRAEAHWVLANVRAELGDRKGFYKAVEAALELGADVGTDLHPRFAAEPAMVALLAPRGPA